MERKDFLYLFAIFILIIVLMNKCGDNTLPKSNVVTYSVKDTTVVTRIDTIPFNDTIKRVVDVPVYTPIYDTLRKSYIYENPYEDSLLAGSIKTTLLDCKMFSQSFTYTPKFPKYIIKTDSVTIHDSTYVERTIYQEPKTQFGVGFSGLLSSQPTIFGNFFVKTKKNDIFALGYDPFYKSFLLTYNKVLTFKRK